MSPAGNRTSPFPRSITMFAPAAVPTRSAQIGPKQAGYQDCKAEHDQKARHRGQSLRFAASILSALTEQLKAAS